MIVLPAPRALGTPLMPIDGTLIEPEPMSTLPPKSLAVFDSTITPVPLATFHDSNPLLDVPVIRALIVSVVPLAAPQSSLLPPTTSTPPPVPFTVPPTVVRRPLAPLIVIVAAPMSSVPPLALRLLNVSEPVVRASVPGPAFVNVPLVLTGPKVSVLFDTVTVRPLANETVPEPRLRSLEPTNVRSPPNDTLRADSVIGLPDTLSSPAAAIRLMSPAPMAELLPSSRRPPASTVPAWKVLVPVRVSVPEVTRMPPEPEIVLANGPP